LLDESTSTELVVIPESRIVPNMTVSEALEEWQNSITAQMESVAAGARALLADVEEMGDITDLDSDYEQKTKKAIVDKAIKEWDAARATVTMPLYNTKKTLDNAFKQAAEPAAQALAILNQRIKQFYIAQQEAARKEQERLNRLAAQKQARAQKRAEDTGTPVPEPIIPMAVIPEPPKTTHTDAGKVSIRKVWKWSYHTTMQDAVKAAVAAGRLDLLCIDERVVSSSVRAGVREMPGIDIYEELEL